MLVCKNQGWSHTGRRWWMRQLCDSTRYMHRARAHCTEQASHIMLTLGCSAITFSITDVRHLLWSLRNTVYCIWMRTDGCVHSVWMHKWFHKCVYCMMVTRNPGNECTVYCSAPLPSIAGMWISWTASPATVCTHHQHTIIVRPNYNSGVQYVVCIYPHLLTYMAIFSVTPLLSCDQADSWEEWKKCECSLADQVTVARPLPLSHTHKTHKEKTSLLE